MGEDRLPVVTGIGVVTALGTGHESFWARLCAGISGIAPVDALAGPDGPRLGAVVRDFDARPFVAAAHLRRMDRISRMIVAASRMALDDAGGAREGLAPEQVGVVVGSAFADVSESASFLERVFTRGPAAASPMIFPNLVLNAPASYVSMELGVTGENLTVSQGESSGELAIALACERVRGGRAEMVVAGGGDELASVVWRAYRHLRALSAQRGGREWSSPYDCERNGVLLGEGAAMLAIEPLARARARGARIYARIAEDACFAVPSSPYDWPERAPAAVPPLRRLLERGRADEPWLVVGAANSSRALDACELDLYANLFAGGNAPVWLTSLKGATGEWGAAGALSVAAACLALREEKVPPLAQLERAEPHHGVRLAGGKATSSVLAGALVGTIARGGSAAFLRLEPAGS